MHQHATHHIKAVVNVRIVVYSRLYEGDEECPPVHDVGQSVYTNGVCGEQGWVKNSRWGHHHQGEAILQKHVAHLREERNW